MPSAATPEAVADAPVEVLATDEPTEAAAQDERTETAAPVAPRYALAPEAAPEETRAAQRGRKQPKALTETAARRKHRLKRSGPRSAVGSRKRSPKLPLRKLRVKGCGPRSAVGSRKSSLKLLLRKSRLKRPQPGSAGRSREHCLAWRLPRKRRLRRREPGSRDRSKKRLPPPNARPNPHCSLNWHRSMRNLSSCEPRKCQRSWRRFGSGCRSTTSALRTLRASPVLSPLPALFRPRRRPRRVRGTATPRRARPGRGAVGLPRGLARSASVSSSISCPERQVGGRGRSAPIHRI